MSPRVRYLSTTVALVALAAAYVLWQGRLERPTPRLPAASAPVIRPASPSQVPRSPTAREILDRAVALELSDQQVHRLHALDRLWTSEGGRLEAAIREAEGEVAVFMKRPRRREAPASRRSSGGPPSSGTSVPSSGSGASSTRMRRSGFWPGGSASGWPRQALSPMKPGGIDEAHQE